MCLDLSHDRGFKQINNSIACYVHRPHGISSVRNGRLGGSGESVATGLLNMSPHLLSKKNQKNQIKKPSSNLQILPNLTPKCCKILH